MIMIVAPCCQSVNDSANSTFLQKGQLCQLKTAEKLRFCIHFSQNKMQNCYLFCLCLSFKLKVKKSYLFLKKKSCIFSFRVDDILTAILISERFRQFYFFTKRSTLLVKNTRKTKFLHSLSKEQNAKLLPFLSMLVVQVKS